MKEVAQCVLLLLVVLTGATSENNLGSQFSTRSFKVPGLLDRSSNWIRAFSPLIAWDSASLHVEVEPPNGFHSENITESIGVVLDQSTSVAVLVNFVFGSAFVRKLGLPSCQLSEVRSNPARIKLRDHRRSTNLPLTAQHPEQCLIAGSKFKCVEVTVNSDSATESARVEQQLHPRYECQVLGISALPNPSLSVVSLPGRPCFDDFICFDRVSFRVVSVSSGPTATWESGFDVAKSYLYSLPQILLCTAGLLLFVFRGDVCDHVLTQYAAAVLFVGCV